MKELAVKLLTIFTSENTLSIHIVDESCKSKVITKCRVNLIGKREFAITTQG